MAFPKTETECYRFHISSHIFFTCTINQEVVWGLLRQSQKLSATVNQKFSHILLVFNFCHVAK